MNTTHSWIQQAARLQQAQQAFALVTVLRCQAPTSAKAGDKAVVTADGQIHGWIGGGCAQPAVIKTVRLALADGLPRCIRISPSDATEERTLGDVLEFGMACHSGGTLELFIDPVRPAAQLTVIGDSPVARALAGLAPRVGLSVAVVAMGASAAEHPDAEQVIHSDEAEAVAAQITSGGLVVVATQGRRDLQGLKAALALKPAQLWFVASARKAAVLSESLVAAGEDAAAVARIHAPAGQAIGAQTPEEIALSVLAAVVAARRAGTSAPVPEAVEVAEVAMATEAAPEAAKSCCGGAAKKAALAAALAEMPAIPGSCCGGA